jgi:hypothetical protein
MEQIREAMPFKKIVLCLVVEEKDCEFAFERLLTQVDSMVRDSVCVYDSDICAESVDVPNAAQIREDELAEHSMPSS